MANTIDNNDFFDTPRDRAYPGADDPEAAFYRTGGREPLHWVDADGAPNPHEGTFSPFVFRYSPPIRQRRHHSLLPWLVVALVILLALPILKFVLTVLAVISFVVVMVVGLGVLALLLTLITGAFVVTHRMRTLSRRMYM